MNIRRALKSPLVNVLLIIVGLLLILSPLFTIYTNLKKDNIDGRGWMTVLEDCRHTGPWDGDSECKGRFRQNGGDVTIENAVVNTSIKYSEGDFLGDIYRDTSISYDAPANEQRYMTGEQRRSLIHNLPSVVTIFAGILLLTYVATYKVRK